MESDLCFERKLDFVDSDGSRHVIFVRIWPLIDSQNGLGTKWAIDKLHPQGTVIRGAEDYLDGMIRSLRMVNSLISHMICSGGRFYWDGEEISGIGSIEPIGDFSR